ncbi:MAG: hypothetical protein LBL82_03540 [Oscillospiraceae bacterium]|jgi:hypothetical protein|nr:hypothetical protein [Oscillospiraceae bacterium]
MLNIDYSRIGLYPAYRSALLSACERCAVLLLLTAAGGDDEKQEEKCGNNRNDDAIDGFCYITVVISLVSVIITP